jgi:hypothetical protein
MVNGISRMNEQFCKLAEYYSKMTEFSIERND